LNLGPRRFQGYASAVTDLELSVHAAHEAGTLLREHFGGNALVDEASDRVDEVVEFAVERFEEAVHAQA